MELVEESTPLQLIEHVSNTASVSFEQAAGVHRIKLLLDLKLDHLYVRQQASKL